MARACALAFVLLLSYGTARASPRPEGGSLLGLPAMPRCPNAEARHLGEQLFRDPRLSADGRVSCATCHRPEHAFTDGKTVAQGVAGLAGTRNTPTLVNVGLLASFAWEGRRTTLDDQVRDALLGSREHGLASDDALLSVIASEPDYPVAFERAYRGSPTPLSAKNARDAISCFVRSLAAGNSAFDRYAFKGDRTALTEAQRRGLALFRGKARCAACHLIGERDATFTDNAFHRVHVKPEVIARLPVLTAQVLATPEERSGELILSSTDVASLGRFVVTRRPTDVGLFRTPSLRNVALTAPYLHDGSEPTLAGVVLREAYYRTADASRPVNLTPSEVDDVVAFLESLTSARYRAAAADHHVPAPTVLR